jgi:hypothetical protein
VAAASAVATVGPTLHDGLLAAKVHGAIAALAASNMDDGFIDEHRSSNGACAE